MHSNSSLQDANPCEDIDEYKGGIQTLDLVYRLRVEDQWRSGDISISRLLRVCMYILLRIRVAQAKTDLIRYTCQLTLAAELAIPR